MKTNGIIYFILGVLVVIAIYSLIQLNKTKKGTTTLINTTSNKRILEATINDVESQQTVPSTVTARQLSEALRKELGEQQVESVNITFKK